MITCLSFEYDICSLLKFDWMNYVSVTCALDLYCHVYSAPPQKRYTITTGLHFRKSVYSQTYAFTHLPIWGI